MIRVNTDTAVTHYSKKFYSVRYMDDGMGVLECKTSGRHIADVIPTGMDTQGKIQVDVFRESENFVKVKK
jgi:hypothetical protein